MEYLPNGTAVSAASNDLYIGDGLDGGIIGDAVDSLTSGAGDVISTVADGAANIASAAGDLVTDAISFNLADVAAAIAIPFPVGAAVAIARYSHLRNRGVDHSEAVKRARKAGLFASAGSFCLGNIFG